MRYADRLGCFGESIFTVLTAMRREREAAGGWVCDLSIGSPNIPPARHIINALVSEAEKPENYKYAIKDLPELQDAAAQWYKRRYGVCLDPRSEISSLLGSQEGLTHIELALVNAGETVLVPDPCYPAFSDGPRIAGAELAYMPLKAENDFVIDLAAIPTETAKKARLMVVSYPNNPTTRLAPDSFYPELISFAKQYDILVLHDNAYSELVFDGRTGGSFLRFDGAKDVGVEYNSLSKTYGLAGARIGFALGNSEVVSAIKLLKSNMDYGMFVPVQKMAIAAITGNQECVAQTRAAYQHRRDLLCDGMNSLGWKVEKPQSTMFVWARIPDKFSGSDAFAMELFKSCGVLVAPGSAFGPSGEGFVRLALVQDDETIAKAIENMRKSEIFS